MKNIKNELQNIITGNGQNGDQELVKTVQNILRANAVSGNSLHKKSLSKVKNKTI